MTFQEKEKNKTKMNSESMNIGFVVGCDIFFERLDKK